MTLLVLSSIIFYYSGISSAGTPAETFVTPDIILHELRTQPGPALTQPVGIMGKSTHIVERAGAKPVNEEQLLSVGPKMNGPWKVLEDGQ